tara:strand:- start:1067 stop:1915 length:849 start_codon:yes stop_codon:yes gene_type:complete
MKKLILISIILTIIFGQIQPIKYEDSYELNGVNFTIKVTVKDARNSMGHGQKIYYSIYKDGNFMHPDNIDGGDLVGCRYPFTEFESNYSVSRIKDNSDTFGWLISTGGICGNTFSYGNVLLVPNPDQIYQSTYDEYYFTSKRIPTFIDNDDYKIDVIYNYQEWGRGGTAWSIYVPERLTIDPYSSGYGSDISKNRIIDIIKILNKDRIKKGLNEIGFLELYMSGFHDMDPALMMYSVNNYLIDEKQLDSYSNFFGSWNTVSKETLIYNIKQIALVNSIDIRF